MTTNLLCCHQKSGILVVFYGCTFQFNKFYCILLINYVISWGTNNHLTSLPTEIGNLGSLTILYVCFIQVYQESVLTTVLSVASMTTDLLLCQQKSGILEILIGCTFLYSSCVVSLSSSIYQLPREQPTYCFAIRNWESWKAQGIVRVFFSLI